MTITSLSFLLFAFITFIVYYLFPKKQWCVLLIASLVFYAFYDFRCVIYVLITAGTVFGATCWMQALSVRLNSLFKTSGSLSKDQKKAFRSKVQRKRKVIMIVTVCINIGLLCFFKYAHFVIDQINAVFAQIGGPHINDISNLIVPLGISFYTFQSIGYLADIYWNYYEPEKSFLKVLLFVSFFPQITQGPISSFDSLSKELFSTHNLKYKNFSEGFQRLLWGFAKKMIIANTLSVCVGHVFENYKSYSGFTALFGMFCYAIQIYADFSGYMDIMCGYCEMLGIKLTENFDKPYFSKSVADYWRRWHISLGDWFKKYLYYPMGMSNWSRRLAKKSKKMIGKQYANAVPATIALIITWAATGLWHGATWAYCVWGLVNGLFLIMTLWLEPLYSKSKSLLHVNEKSKLWKLFQIARTFVIVMFIKVLPEVGTLKDGLMLWEHALCNHRLSFELSAIIQIDGLDKRTCYLFFGLAMVGSVAMFVFSMIQRKKRVREFFNQLPFVVRLTALVTLTMLVITFGVLITFRSGNGGFLYAQF